MLRFLVNGAVHGEKIRHVRAGKAGALDSVERGERLELVYVIEGSVVYEADGEWHNVAPGGFVLGRPGTISIHTVSWTGLWFWLLQGFNRQ